MGVKRESGDEQTVVDRSVAPALEKGLDILETLAEQSGPLSQKALALQVGRSVNEIFRMLVVLERRRYILRDAETGQYALSHRLLELGNRHPPTRRLQRAALPVLEQLAVESRLSCHLIVQYHERMQVIAHADPDLPMSWTVKLGATFPLAASYASARILAAFQPAHRRARLLALMTAHEPGTDRAALTRRLEAIAARGHDVASSEVTAGITDISFPVLDQHRHAIAALTVAWLPQRGLTPPRDELVRAAERAARTLSATIGGIPSA